MIKKNEYSLINDENENEGKIIKMIIKTTTTI